MKKLFVVFYLFVSSLLFSSQKDQHLKVVMNSLEYQKSHKEWKRCFEQRCDPTLRSSLLEDASFVQNKVDFQSVKWHLDRAQSIKKSLSSNSYILSYPQQMAFLSNAAYHEHVAYEQQCRYLDQKIDFTANQIKEMVSKDFTDDDHLSVDTIDSGDSGRTTGASFSSSASNFSRGSRSSTIVSNDINEDLFSSEFNFSMTEKRLDALLSEKHDREFKYAASLKKLKKKEALSVLLVPKFKKDCDESGVLRVKELEIKRQLEENRRLQAEKAIHRFQAVVRGYSLRKNLPSIQQEILCKKEQLSAEIARQLKDQEKILEAEDKARVELQRKNDLRQAAIEKKNKQRQLSQKNKNDARLRNVEEAKLLDDAFTANLLLRQKMESDKKRSESLINLKKMLDAILPSIDSNYGIEFVANELAPIIVENMINGGINSDFVQPLACQSIIYPHLRTIDDEFSNFQKKHPSFNDSTMQSIIDSISADSLKKLKIVNDRMNLKLTDEQLIYLVQVGQYVDYAILFLKYRDNNSK